MKLKLKVEYGDFIHNTETERSFRLNIWSLYSCPQYWHIITSELATENVITDVQKGSIWHKPNVLESIQLHYNRLHPLHQVFQNKDKEFYLL